jgi:hypothetical protein
MYAIGTENDSSNAVNPIKQPKLHLVDAFGQHATW